MEWAIVASRQMSNVQLYHGKNKLYLYIILHHRCGFFNGKTWYTIVYM